MFLQMTDEPRSGYITDQLKSLSVTESAPPQLQVGALCVAQYSLDNEWYRASVQRVISKDPVNPQYAVIFLDFGNTDRVGGKNVRQIDSALAAVPAQAHSCSLAYLKVNLSTMPLQHAAHMILVFLSMIQLVTICIVSHWQSYGQQLLLPPCQALKHFP